MHLVKYWHGLTSKNEDLPLYLWKAYIYLPRLRSLDGIDIIYNIRLGKV